jgi:hypothetical protein
LDCWSCVSVGSRLATSNPIVHGSQNCVCALVICCFFRDAVLCCGFVFSDHRVPQLELLVM